jgi:hypothetical protein
MYSLAVERYCGGYDGAASHEESARVTDAKVTITDDAEDVEAPSSSLHVLCSSGTAACDVIVPPELSGATELNMSQPRPGCGTLATSVDI